MKWTPRSIAQQIVKPVVGQIVHLRLIDGFSYRIKVRVDAVDGHAFQGEVDGIFAWEGDGEIISGEIADLRGKRVSFSDNDIHEVI